MTTSDSSRFFPVLVCFLLGAWPAIAQQTAQITPGEQLTVVSKNLRDGIDTSVSPCDDFAKFANGRWLAENSAKRIEYSIDVGQRTDAKLIAILDNAKTVLSTTSDPTEKVLGIFYASCLATDNIQDLNLRTPGGATARSRADQCLAITDKVLRNALATQFVKRMDSEAPIENARAWVATIKPSIREQLNKHIWITNEAKQAALTMLDSVEMQMAPFPTAFNYSQLVLSPSNFKENRATLETFAKSQREPAYTGRAKVSPPYYLQAEASMSPSNHKMSGIFVTLMLFQPPFYSPSWESAANYAALGTVFAHEMWHVLMAALGLGSPQTESNRTWAEPTVKRYESLGENSSWGTLKEDLSDIGGVQATYDAWQRHGQSEKVQNIEGFSPEQRFFLYYARLHRNTFQLTRGLQHSSPRSRINGVVMASPAFAKAFGCKEGATMAPKHDSTTLFFPDLTVQSNGKRK